MTSDTETDFYIFGCAVVGDTTTSIIEGKEANTAKINFYATEQKLGNLA